MRLLLLALALALLLLLLLILLLLPLSLLLLLLLLLPPLLLEVCVPRKGVQQPLLPPPVQCLQRMDGVGYVRS
ncbi:hypothetical protein FACS189472_09670 [Alphaproteobacteria bacterium]|nr:hypothetical protein FACS189472_09670 [Alphaproteobacteria bacterium]